MRLIYLALLSTLLLLPACSLDIPVENELTDPKVVTSVESAYELLSAAYTAYPKEELSLSMLSDELVPTFKGQRSNDIAQLYTYNVTALEQLSESLWQSYYSSIVQINALLDRLPALREQLGTRNASQIDYLQAEAQTLKALCYLQLVQLYATPWDDTQHPQAVVIKNQTAQQNLPRSTKSEVAQTIESNLRSALQLFASGATPAHGGSVGFLSAESAQLLLARLYLYQGQWSQVETALQPLTQTALTPQNIPLTTGTWLTANSQTTLFASNVPESYYNGSIANGANLSEATYELPRSRFFASGDLRRNAYVADSTRMTASGQSDELQPIGKYFHLIIERTLPRYAHHLRRSEIPFLLAEAQAQQGRDAEARSTLNSYLSLVQAPTLDESLTGTALTNRIIEEKGKEFAGEGLFFFDLKRLRRPITHYSPDGERISLTIAVGDYRRTLPIPRAEWQPNTLITEQNEGWSMVR